MNLLLEIRRCQQLFGLRLRPQQVQQTIAYLELLLKWSRRVNLIGERNPARLLRFHFFESYWLGHRFLSPGQSVVDIGTGAGFPGMACKVFYPSLQMTLIEPTNKKRVFLREVAHRLGLEVALFGGRAESFPGWEGVKVATLRALKLSPRLASTLQRYRVPLVALHGQQPIAPSEWLKLRSQYQVPRSKRRWASSFEINISGGDNPVSRETK